MTALPLLDLMHTPPIREAVTPDGEVIQGDVDETLTLPMAGRKNWQGVPQACIELHRDRARDLWMWAVQYNLEIVGTGCRVGPKWGNFTDTRDAALHWACAELLDEIADHGTPAARRIRAWAERLT